MTDKEIAGWLRKSRVHSWWAISSEADSLDSYHGAWKSVHIIHNIINSINWED